MASPGRRFLITVGIGNYQDREIDDLPGVDQDVRHVRALLEPMGYKLVLPHLAKDPAARDVAQSIEAWTASVGLGPADIVVLYFAGHGLKDLDRHYLLCSTSRPGLIDSTALASEDLGRSLVKSAVGQLLIILDTCYAAEGTGDLATLATQLARFQRGAAGRWLLASARGKEKARENAFVDAMTEVLTRPRAGALQEFVGVREVTQRVNEYFAAHGLSQHARHSTIDSDGHAPFFRNKAHLPGLPTSGLDGDTVLRLRGRTGAHFETRARGVGSVEERGDYFTGRAGVLDELTDWLNSPRHDGRARVVTGDPGSGKSAVLGRLLRRMRDHHPVVQLHARNMSLEDLAGDLSRAVGRPGTAPEGLLVALAELSAPVTVLVDALDEAGAAGDVREGRLIARQLLRPMSALPTVRLVVGTRRSLLDALGEAVEVIDLDERSATDDIADYARKVLLDGDERLSSSPYRDAPEAAAAVARGIAARADRSFLVARMTARALVRLGERVDINQHGWEQTLPSRADEAFEAYLRQFGDDRQRVEQMLRPLAYAQGVGLPWSTVWAPVAEALSQEPCSQENLTWLHEHAGSYVVETVTPEGGSAFRLFHESLAEYLRERGPGDAAAHAAITRTLLTQVSVLPGVDVRDWAGAHEYLRDHLATHAAAGGLLDDLLGDTEFLVHASPTHLIGVLDVASADDCRRRAAVYRASFEAHVETTAEERRDILAVDAARFGQSELSRECARGRRWRPQWATGSLIHPALRSTLRGHPRLVQAVDCTFIDGRPHSVTGVYSSSPTDIEVWDLTDGTQRTALSGHTSTVRAVVCVTMSGVPHVVSGSDDGTVRLWNLVEEREVLACPTGPVKALACTVIDGRLHALVACEGSTTVWDLTEGTRRRALNGPRYGVRALGTVTLDGRPHLLGANGIDRICLWDLTSGRVRNKLILRRFRRLSAYQERVVCTVVDGQPHAVVAHWKDVQIWNLATGRRRARFPGMDDRVTGAACTAHIEGRPHVLIAFGKAVAIWDLVDGKRRAVLTGHTEDVNGLACTSIDGRPHAVTIAGDGVRIWNLADASLQAAHAGHTSAVTAVACAAIGDRPYAVTGDRTGQLRLWDLVGGLSEATATGNSSWITALAWTRMNGRPHTVVGDSRGRLHLWCPGTDAKPRKLSVEHPGGIDALACTTVTDRPYALTAQPRGVIKVSDLMADTLDTAFSAPASRITGMACTTLSERIHVLIGSIDSLGVWELSGGRSQLGQQSSPLSKAQALACIDIDGTPHALVANWDGIRVWNLHRPDQHTLLDDAHRLYRLRALTCTVIDGRPHAVALVDARVLKVWDLTTCRLLDTMHLPLDASALDAHGPHIVVGMADEVVVLTQARPRS
ncbi:caspase family protein [Streptomyces sp. NPDC003362]